MTDNDRSESRLDTVTSRLLDNFAQRVSRRGMLARLGKFALGLTGLSLIPNLPIDRTFTVDADGGPGCGDWRTCGMYGSPCKACCDGTGSLTMCPSCTLVGSFWSKCCFNPVTCTNKLVRYIDCCGGTHPQVGNCAGPFCTSGTVQPSWCAGGGTYRCTRIAVVGDC